MFDYQRSDTTQTLREGIAEFRVGNTIVANQREMSALASDFFSSHDACHVLFGLDTSLEQEALVDAWMLFGTTATLSHFKKYVDLEEHKDIIKRNGYPRVIKTFFKALPGMLGVIRHSRAMPKKWPWDDFDEHLDVPLCRLRDDFNIKLIKASHASG